MNSSNAAFVGFWCGLNAALAARHLPEADHDEALLRFRQAQEEAERVTFRHLKARHCTGTCPTQDGV